MQSIFKRLTVFAFAVSITYVTAVFFVSQFNIASIIALGFEVNLATRANTFVEDIVGMSSLYLLLIAIALAIALLFTSKVLLRFINANGFLFALAGFVGIIAIHFSLELAFGTVPVAPTRTLPGLLSQGLAGAIGGWIYFRLRGCFDQQVD